MQTVLYSLVARDLYWSTLAQGRARYYGFEPESSRYSTLLSTQLMYYIMETLNLDLWAIVKCKVEVWVRVKRCCGSCYRWLFEKCSSTACTTTSMITSIVIGT